MGADAGAVAAGLFAFVCFRVESRLKEQLALATAVRFRPGKVRVYKIEGRLDADDLEFFSVATDGASVDVFQSARAGRN